MAPVGSQLDEADAGRSRAAEDRPGPDRPDRRVTVVVADDSEIYRAGLVRAIRASDGLDLLAEVGGGVAAVEAVRRLEPAVLVVDYRMPDLDGLEVAIAVRGGEHECRIVLLSAYKEEMLADQVRGRHRGDDLPFDAVVDKARSRRDIVDLISGVADGDAVL